MVVNVRCDLQEALCGGEVYCFVRATGNIVIIYLARRWSLGSIAAQASSLHSMWMSGLYALEPYFLAYLKAHASYYVAELSKSYHT